MEQIQGWLADGARLTALTAFLFSVGAAFLLGLVVGRGGRRRRRMPPPPFRPFEADAQADLPVLDDDARLMDLEDLRGDEGEPPSLGARPTPPIR